MGVAVREKQKGSNEWWLFIRHKGERVSQLVGEKDVADDAAKDIRTDIRRGKFDIAAMKAARAKAVVTPTLSEFYDKTITPLWEASVAKGTLTRYDQCFRIHIIPAIGHIQLGDLTRDHVRDFVLSLCVKDAQKRASREDAQEKEAARLLSKDSIRNIVASLRAALNEAIERKLMTTNPAVKLGKFYKEVQSVRAEVDVLTPEEIPVLLETMLIHFGFENYVVTLTALHSGLRSAELAGLQWSDVDFRGRFLMVRRQYKDGVKWKTKTKKMRKVDVSDALLQELKTLRKQRQEEYLRRGKSEIPDWVFLSPGKIIWEDGKQVGNAEGGPLNMDNFRNRVYWKALDKAKLRRRQLHDTRHTFASILLMNGESPAYVKDQLGHSSITMTVDTYGHFLPGANRQAVNKLPSLSTETPIAEATNA